MQWSRWRPSAILSPVQSADFVLVSSNENVFLELKAHRNQNNAARELVFLRSQLENRTVWTRARVPDDNDRKHG